MTPMRLAKYLRSPPAKKKSDNDVSSCYTPTAAELNEAISNVLKEIPNNNTNIDSNRVRSNILKNHSSWRAPERRVRKFLNQQQSTRKSNISSPSERTVSDDAPKIDGDNGNINYGCDDDDDDNRSTISSISRKAKKMMANAKRKLFRNKKKNDVQDDDIPFVPPIDINVSSILPPLKNTDSLDDDDEKSSLFHSISDQKGKLSIGSSDENNYDKICNDEVAMYDKHTDAPNLDLNKFKKTMEAVVTPEKKMNDQHKRTSYEVVEEYDGKPTSSISDDSLHLHNATTKLRTSEKDEKVGKICIIPPLVITFPTTTTDDDFKSEINKTMYNKSLCDDEISVYSEDNIQASTDASSFDDSICDGESDYCSFDEAKIPYISNDRKHESSAAQEYMQKSNEIATGKVDGNRIVLPCTIDESSNHDSSLEYSSTSHDNVDGKKPNKDALDTCSSTVALQLSKTYDIDGVTESGTVVCSTNDDVFEYGKLEANCLQKNKYLNSPNHDTPGQITDQSSAYVDDNDGGKVGRCQPCQNECIIL